MNKEKIDKKILTITKLAFFFAIILLMAFTPVGYIKTAGIEITIITIPVIVGAALMGRRAGAMLGFLFGATSFIQAFTGLSAFGGVIFAINPILAFITCVPTRILMGYLTGLFFDKVKDKSTNYFIGGLLGSLLNTVLFVSVFMLSYWHSDYVETLAEGFGTTGILAFIFAFVGFNGIIEAIFNTIISGALITALKKANI